MVPSVEPTHRPLRKRVLSVLLCTLAALLAVEIAARVLWHPAVVGVERYTAISPSFDFGFELAQPLCLDDGSSWLFLPTQYRYAVHRQRLARPKPEDGVRFVTLGGSVSAGGPESYTHRLRDGLEARYGAVCWESLNLSNHGYGTTRMLVMMEELPGLEPDFVILDCTGTNEFEDERDRARMDFLNSGLGAVLYRSHALVLIKKKLIPRLAAAGMKGAPRYDGPTEAEASAVEENVRRWLSTLDRNLAEMVRIAQEHGISVVLMGRSVRERMDEGSRYDRINESIRSHVVDENVLYVDTQGAMHEHVEPARLYREDGLHVNDAGHAAIAGILAERVVPGLPRIEARVAAITRAASAGR